MRRTNRLVQYILTALGIVTILMIVRAWFIQVRSPSFPVEHPLHQKEGYYLDRKQNKKVSFSVPFHIREISVEPSNESSTRVLLQVSQLDSGIVSQLENAVYTVEVHTPNIVVIYTHNFRKTGFLKVRGVAGDDKVVLVRRLGAIPIAEGSLQFANAQKKSMIIQVPMHLSKRDIKAVYFRYLPSVEAAKESRTRPPIVSGIFFQRGRFDTRMPGWP
ncbi:MAG: hypothetical protein KatS3mg019_1714 [Fimbriimonadales bacterium]|nr:MAG: hypothetical protein KatS3mg019_1714 [Fimbriimonadales bacterium]